MMQITPLKRRSQINLSHLFRNQITKPTKLNTYDQCIFPVHKRSYILVVSKCMLSLFRPSFEVVKGRTDFFVNNSHYYSSLNDIL
jgi:hypothetical protein